jgi:hypothetical protein
VGDIWHDYWLLTVLCGIMNCSGCCTSNGVAPRAAHLWDKSFELWAKDDIGYVLVSPLHCPKWRGQFSGTGVILQRWHVSECPYWRVRR